MTTGQRIAQKRKELGLSQEALGEQMGVSRQAIYKWESDTALPEIDKLVALAKLFGVTVGWLLGVEEDAAPQPENEELTPAQMKMVSEIVDRYIAAQPKPKKRRKWPWVVASVALLIAVVSLVDWMDRLDNRYSNLQNSVNNITSSVNSQISGIAGRVEEILQAQNNLTAEFDTELVMTDYSKNTVTIAMDAVPKTYTEGMEAVFVVDNGIEATEFPGQLGDGLTFSAEAQVTLTDNITASVVFVSPDGVHQTQLMDCYSNLYSQSFVELRVGDHDLWRMKAADGKLTLKNIYFTAYESGYNGDAAAIASYQVGLFLNQKLVAWAEPCEKPANYSGSAVQDFHRLPDLVLEDLEPGDLLTVAALVTDIYGRQYMAFEIPYLVHEDMELTYPERITYDKDPADWQFD